MSEGVPGAFSDVGILNQTNISDLIKIPSGRYQMMQFLAASSASLDEIAFLSEHLCSPGLSELQFEFTQASRLGRNPRRWFEAQPAGELKRSFPSRPSVSHTRYDYAEEDLSVRLMERRKEEDIMWDKIEREMSLTFCPKLSFDFCSPC